MVPGRWRGGDATYVLDRLGDNAVWFAFINATLPAVDNCAVGGVATCKGVQSVDRGVRACSQGGEVWDRDGPYPRQGTRGLFSLVPFW